jgi:hypothetical protein
MTLKKYIPILLIGCIILVIFLMLSTQHPVSAGDNPAVKPAAFPKYPVENFSTTVRTPRGTMIINAHVPESYQIMPIYRLNLSCRQTLTLNRVPDTPEFPNDIDTNPANPTTPGLSEAESRVITEKFLRQYHIFPDDAVVWQVRKTDGGNKRIIYTRIINGQIVDNWGIMDEHLVTDHDFIIVGLRHDGDLLSISERWTKSDYIRNEPVISAKEALERLMKWENAYEDYGEIPNLKVNSIRLGYFEYIGFTSIIEPSWFFYGINENGFNQTVVVFARKNESVFLPFYNWSHRDPSLSDSSLVQYQENFIGKNYTGITRPVDYIQEFSGNPDLIIYNSTLFSQSRGCGYTFLLYNVTTSEGIYKFDPELSTIRSITYYKTSSKHLLNPVDYPQALNISVDYIHKKFGNYSFNYLARNPYINENPENISLSFQLSNSQITLKIDKITGDILAYYNDSAERAYCV